MINAIIIRNHTISRSKWCNLTHLYIRLALVFFILIIVWSILYSVRYQNRIVITTSTDKQYGQSARIL